MIIIDKSATKVNFYFDTPGFILTTLLFLSNLLMDPNKLEFLTLAVLSNLVKINTSAYTVPVIKIQRKSSSGKSP